MSEFKAITTQEEFDSAIKKRLEQKEREVSERYKDYTSPDDVAKLKGGYEDQIKGLNTSLLAANEKIKTHDSEIADFKAKAAKAELDLLKGHVATSKGVPLGLANRLVGTTKEELEKDAETLAGFLKPQNVPPLRSNDPGRSGDPAKAATDEALASLLSSLTNAN